MTDKEIIKALECCLNTPVDCDNCAYTKYPVRDCNKILINDITDLINIQQAEIERLTDRNKRLGEGVGWLLNNENGIELIRAEAIKEYAARLKEFKYLQYEGEVVSVHCIDDIAEEMVGAE